MIQNKIKEEIKKNIPEEMKEKGFFCIWNKQFNDKGEVISKIPLAKTNQKETFSNYNAIIQKELKEHQGIGIGLFDNLCAIDIDHCINEEGEMSPLAKDIIQQINTYTEISPSGTGLHLYFNIKDLNISEEDYKEKYYLKNSKINLEIYIPQITNRFLTITGNKLNDNKFNEIEFKKLKQILDKYMKKPSMNTSSIVNISEEIDKDYLQQALERGTDTKLIELWNSRPSGSGGNESETDLALLLKLAYYDNKDSEKMKRDFEDSPYFRQKDSIHIKKWNNRKDYSEETINKAIAQTITTAREQEEKYLSSRIKSNNKTIINREEQESEMSDFNIESMSIYNNIDKFFEISKSGIYRPISTGIQSLDNALEGGFSNQSIVTIGGGSSTGKTTLAIQLALEFAKDRPIIYYTLENSKEQIYSKVFSRLLYVKAQMEEKSTNFLRCYEEDNLKRFINQLAIDHLKESTELKNFFVIYPKTTTYTELEETLKNISKQCEKLGKKSPCLVLDYLQFITSKSNEDEMTTIKKTQKILEDYIIKNNSITFLLVANNRSSGGKQESTLSSGRGTSDIEYSSDYNLQINFYEYEHQKELGLKGENLPSRTELSNTNPRKMSITIQKNRFGQSGTTIDFEFNGITNSFNEITKEQKKTRTQSF